MKKLLRYLKHYKKESILAPLFKMLEASFELIIPLVTAQIIDVGIAQQNIPHIWKMCIIMVALGAVGLVCSLTAQFYAAKAAMGFSTELRRDLFAHINGFSYEALDRVGTSTLITRMTSDVNQAQTGVNLVLRLFLRSPFIVVGAVIMAFVISPSIGIVFLVAVPLISIVIYWIMRITVPIYKDVQKKLDRISLITRENHVGARVVRAFGRQSHEMEAFDETNGQFTRIQIAAGRISALLNPATYVIMNLGIISILWYGGNQVYGGTITQGEVTALVNYMTQVLLALLAVVNLVVAVTKAIASVGRLNEVFAIESGTFRQERAAQREKPGAPRVSYEAVTFTYAGDSEPVLENISFEAFAGETVGIIGGTGSGKSTLVNLIPGFYLSSKGEIKIDGCPVDAYPLEQLRSKIGVVPQRAVLFKGTLRENMKWGKEDATDEEIWKALEIAQAKEFVEGRQEGLDLLIEQGGQNLSGGQRQRLTIARALAKRPSILILDDSASALDFATDAALRKAIGRNTKDMTVFIVSQRAAAIMQAQHILVLDDGRMAGWGTHEELLKNCSVYREICLSQLSQEEVRAV